MKDIKLGPVIRDIRKDKDFSLKRLLLKLE